MSQAKVYALFSTPLLINDLAGPSIDEMNAELLDCILKRARTDGDPGITKSNAGSTWHSDYNMTEWCPPILTLVEHIRKSAMRMLGHYGAVPGAKINMAVCPWAMLSKGTGDYGVPHTHPRCQLSGVYYVSIGESDPAWKYSGRIELFNPTGFGHFDVPGMRGLHKRELFTPQPGRLLMFPAELLHMVHPYHGTGDRVAVAYNIHVRSYTAPEQQEGASNG